MEKFNEFPALEQEKEKIVSQERPVLDIPAIKTKLCEVLNPAESEDAPAARQVLEGYLDRLRVSFPAEYFNYSIYHMIAGLVNKPVPPPKGELKKDDFPGNYSVHSILKVLSLED